MKKTFTVDAQEELGSRIDLNLQNADMGTAEEKLLATPIVDVPSADILPSQQKGREVRPLVKQMWLDEEIYNRCIEVQAERKKKHLPGSFDALAYDALVHYLKEMA